MALEQNKGRRPHSHSGNQESNHSSSAEVKNASEIKKRESAPLSEKEQDLKAQIARGKRLQEESRGRKICLFWIRSYPKKERERKM